MVNLSLFYHHFGGIYHRGLRLAAPKVRRVAQPICRQFADHSWEFADSADFGCVESTDNLPIFARNLPIFALAEFRNPSIIHRRIGSIHRSGDRIRSVEASGNRQIDSPVDRSSGLRNHQLIVNQFHVIINSAAWNLSPVHHQNGEIYHRMGRPPAIRLLDLSDNHPTVAADLEADEEDRG